MKRLLVATIGLSTAVVGLGVCLALSSVPPASAKPSTSRQTDKAVAKASVLVIGDFPSGWRTQDPMIKEGERVRSQTPECKNYNRVYKRVRRTPLADSPTFAQSDQMSVDDTVVVFPNEQAASKAVTDAFAAKTYESCVSVSGRKLLENRLHKRNVQYDDVKVEVGDLSADQVGDATTAKSLVVTITQGSAQTTLYGELENVRVGRAVTSLTFQNTFSQFPEDLKASLINTAVTRLRQALGSSGASSSPASTTTPAPPPMNPPTVSLAEYNAIQSGWTLQQVIDTIGGPGQLESQSVGNGYKYESYKWIGTGFSSFGNAGEAHIQFSNDKVESKSQNGLQ